MAPANSKSSQPLQDVRSCLITLNDIALGSWPSACAVFDYTSLHKYRLNLEKLGDVGESIRSLSTMNQAIAAAAEEQSATTNSVSQNVSSIQAIAQQTEELMKMTSDASNSLQKVTGELNSHVGQFKI